MATEKEAQDMDSQIQEKTVSSFTEDLKTKSAVCDEKKESAIVSNGDELEEDPQHRIVTVQASDSMNEEKKAMEERPQDESMKAENVSSTEAGANSNETSISEEEKKNGIEEGKNQDEAQKKDEGLGSTVAKHYNEIPAGTKDLRKESRIFHLRNFNNWIKSVIINEYLQKVKRRKRTSDDVNVLDLACGKGGDLLKWQKGKVDHVIMADIADASIGQCKERYAKLEKEQSRSRYSRDNPLFTIETFAEDCTKVLLKEKFKKPDIKLDLTSCQFAYHYSFESYAQAETMLRNACENLRVGGYFIGTTPDAQKLVKHIKDCKADSFGNSVFNIKPDDKEKFPLFGAKYMFYLEGVVDCPEFLVYFPVLEKLAEKYHMKLVWKKNFHQLFKEYEKQYSYLLSKMNAMEQYPASGDKTLTGGSESQYKCAKDYIEKKGVKRVGTLSADEWEVAGLYLAFAFEKIEPPREGRSTEREDRKRHRDDRSKDSTKSRSSHRHDDRRRSSESSSAKKQKKESESEEVYEVKDEIYEDETEKVDQVVEGNASTEETVERTTVTSEEMPSSTTANAEKMPSDSATCGEEIPSETEKPTEESVPEKPATEEIIVEEPGTEVVDADGHDNVEVAQEVDEKDD